MSYGILSSAENLNKKNKGLGKGLGALIPGIDSLDDFSADNNDSTNHCELRIIDIEPCKNQPRKNFNTEQLEILADSIKNHGVIQPIIVRSLSNGRFEIIAGERRWRAARMAGLKTIPSVVKEFPNSNIMEIALIENLQREDLNPIDEALGFQALIDEYNFTQEQISLRVGKSRSAVANALRLITLPDEVKKLVIDGDLSAGHARAIVSVNGVENQINLALLAVENSLSVREIERIISNKKNSCSRKKDSEVNENVRLYLNSIESQISERFGTKVQVSSSKNGGKIEISYFSKDDLDRILSLLCN